MFNRMVRWLNGQNNDTNGNFSGGGSGGYSQDQGQEYPQGHGQGQAQAAAQERQQSVAVLSPEHAQACILDVYKDRYSSIDSTEDQMISNAGGNSTYGEITFDALKTIHDDLGLTSNDYWFDLGSGMGKVVLHTAMTTPARCCGVELSTTRISHARDALSQLINNHNLDLAKKVQFRNENIATVDLSGATIVYMCSTCYSEKLMRDIINNVCQLKPGTRLLTLKSAPEHPALKYIKTYSLRMTWSSEVSVHLYVVQPT